MKVLLFFLSFLISVFIVNGNENEMENRINKFMSHNGECNLPDNLRKEIEGYQETVHKIVREITDGQFAGNTWSSLSELTDKFGSRLSGTENLEHVIDFVVEKFNESGLENVHTENATVAHWVRGYESASMITPRKANFQILGLGTSVGTMRGGIIAEAVVVESFEEFANFTEEQVRGKIVVFVPKWESYGKTVKYRGKGASVASKKGAVAALVRSITPHSINSPHTGMQSYEEGVNKIPVACLTVEDAEMLLRIYRRGERITIKLEMEDRNLDPVISRNTIGELTGTVENSTVVVVSGHLDSWDVGVGAMDDGGGAFISWKAVEFLKKMGLRPRRTIRTILWTGEEFGYMGAYSYREAHKETAKSEFNFFMESDIGTFEPQGIDFSGNKDAECILREILPLMAPLNATQFEIPSDGGPDISIWFDDGFPGASLINKNEKYFWYHHSAGDSMLVEDPKALDKCTALWAAVSYIIADLSIEMPKDLKED